MSQTTKRALAMSLKHIMAKKPLSKITIADITEDCGINRMTFYYHFQDIFDLIDWICQEEGAKAIQGRKNYKPGRKGFSLYAVQQGRTGHLWKVCITPSSEKKSRIIFAELYMIYCLMLYVNYPRTITFLSKISSISPIFTNMDLWVSY